MSKKLVIRKKTEESSYRGQKEPDCWGKGGKEDEEMKDNNIYFLNQLKMFSFKPANSHKFSRQLLYFNKVINRESSILQLLSLKNLVFPMNKAPQTNPDS